MSGYTPLLTEAALRALAGLSPRTAGPLLAFVCGSLAGDPRHRSHQLRGELADCRSARRGDYRVLIVLDEESRTMSVADISPRTTVYRTSQRCG
ncbi:type II toxin-antitoxin system RelE family toxin [Sinomonas sp.]|uniref:type II toxin-antitoxin system RelE family toxin n=1 Tax=Sinomonas sp. TaxID=1914986 RepID=UPI002FE050AC